MTRLAVVLFNLGGPDSLEAVRPFLFNLFRDPAIIGLPAVARYPLASLISRRREKLAQENYKIMGGRSPLLPETERQAQALQAELARARPDLESRVFIAMRYWNPLADETARQVAEYRPDEIVLLPLYPQYSTTTTASSVKDWQVAYKGPGRSRTICCYPTAGGLIESHARAIEAKWSAAGRPQKVRLLFSAHGLPEKVVQSGDPYRAQVEATAEAIVARLADRWDWQVCYQSRVGPLKWIGPSTDDEVRRAGAEGLGVVISPIAFVSEHVETLVELDHEYRALADQVGCSPYIRVPALAIEDAFVQSLAGAVTEALSRSTGAAPYGPWRCPGSFGKCPLNGAAA